MKPWEYLCLVWATCTLKLRAENARDDLGRIERLLEVVDELLLVAGEGLLLGAAEDLAGAGALALDGGQAAGEDGLADEGDGHAEVKGCAQCVNLTV
jgi:hypothetical protein